MKSLFKEFNYFTRRERRGILVLITLIILVFSFGYLFTHQIRNNYPTKEEQLQHSQLIAICDSFFDSIKEKKPTGEKKYPKRNLARRSGYQRQNPKSASSTRNDTTAAPQQIIIQAEKDTFPRITKLVAGETLSLNEADTTALKRIPGIGSYIAKRIVTYRSQLGGFYCIEQLKEIRLDHRQLKSWFVIHSDSIQRLNVNQLSVARLQRHPYINFHQARAIVEYRKKHGKLTSLKPFRLLEEFTENDLERLKHYICFE